MHADQFRVHSLCEETHWWFTGRRAIISGLVKSVVPPSMDKLVLEIGCGTGANIAALNSMYSCIGTDIHAGAIEQARQKYPECTFARGLAPEDFQSEVGRASVILLLDVLEHVPDDFLLLSKLLALSPPGCVFIVTVPAGMHLWSRHDVTFGHYRRYDVPRLVRLWSGLDVSQHLCTYFNSHLYGPIRAARWLNRRREKTFGIAGTDFVQSSGLVNRVLKSIFMSEQRRLLDALKGVRPFGFRRGVSLVAVIRRGSGGIAVREKPDDVGRDYYDPVTGEYSGG